MAVDVASYEKIDEYPADAIRLFKVMMRLEFALKECGYCTGQEGEKVGANWDRLSNKILKKSFFAEIYRSGKANTLIQSPPKHQIIDPGGSLGWKEPGEVTCTRELVAAVQRVRNNLFHGGKSGDPDRDRNDELVNNALFVIDEMLKKDIDLRMRFDGHY